jgi:SprT protein
MWAWPFIRSNLMHDRQPDLKLTLQAERAVRDAELRVRRFYGINLPEAAIDFSLRGRCAGQARIDREGRTSVRINHQLLAENLSDFLKNTIPHEIAHLVVNWQARNKRRRPRPHGPEWQAVMHDCFGLEATRCHHYRTTPARIVPRPFLYRCSCREHYLTGTLHNRISVTYQVLCKACKTPVTFIAKQNP